jgi:hypothetical protein
MNAIAKLQNVLTTGIAHVANDDGMTIGIRSNIARDALKRASDFRTVEDCIFEAVANAYEAYNIGETPFVSIEVRKAGKGTTVVIRDRGVGMCSAKGLRRFFSLHLKTERRENGLNMRGYNGTGKIAAFKFARRMQVETVKDGLRNIVLLTADMLERAAADETPPNAQFLFKDQPTDDPNGTTITISDIREGFSFNAETMRGIQQKLAFEQMMWMKNGVIELNGEVVPAQEVDFTDRHEVTSECGNFSLVIFHNKMMPYQAELPAVYMSAGRVFLAREQYGMEGRRFKSYIHVESTTTEEWAQAHFYDNRERFVSESRDLKLKLNNNPEAQAYAKFVELEVGRFMDKLEAEYEADRLKSMKDWQAKLEEFLSKSFSNLLVSTGGKRTDGVKTGGIDAEIINVVSRVRSNDTKGNGEKPSRLLNIEFIELADELPFDINYQNRRVLLNKNFGPLKGMASSSDNIAYQVAALELASDAFCDLVAHVDAEAEFGDSTPDRDAVVALQRASYQKVRLVAARVAGDLYQRFAREAAAVAEQLDKA